MGKDRERQLNPAAAQLKVDKARALKRSKAQLIKQRNEKLARRNPERIQRQIEELKAVETNGGLRPKDRQTLDQLEKDVKAIRKARETLGDKAPDFGRADGQVQMSQGRRDTEVRGGQRGRGRGTSQSSVLGKRRKFEREQSSETDDDARDIPMPNDVENMPPVPRRNRSERTPLNVGDTAKPHILLVKPSATSAQTVYESAPAIRNLQKIAVSRFVPAAVQAKIKAAKGNGRLLEPEEAEKLESAGYRGSAAPANGADKQATLNVMSIESTSNDLDEEERRFERELKWVEIEEVEDEDI